MNTKMDYYNVYIFAILSGFAVLSNDLPAQVAYRIPLNRASFFKENDTHIEEAYFS